MNYCLFLTAQIVCKCPFIFQHNFAVANSEQKCKVCRDILRGTSLLDPEAPKVMLDRSSKILKFAKNDILFYIYIIYIIYILCIYIHIYTNLD